MSSLRLGFLYLFPLILSRFKVSLSVIVLFVCTSIDANAQKKASIDSLQYKLVNSTGKLEKLKILNKLSSEMMDVNIPLAHNYIDSAIHLAKLLNYPSELAQAYQTKGQERWLNGYYYLAEEYYHKSIKLNLSLNDSSALATNYSFLGLSFHYHSQTDSALYYHLKAKTYNEALKKWSNVAHNLDNIALVYEKIGQFDKVIEYSSRALEIRTTLPGYNSRTNIYNYGGVIFDQKAFEETIKYHKNVYKQVKFIATDRVKIANSLNNIGSSFYAVEMYDSAINYLSESAGIMKLLNIPNWYAGHLNELGEALRANDNLLEAEQVFETAKNIWDSVGHRTSRAIVRYNLGILYFKQKNTERAISYLDSAHQVFTSMHYNPFLIKIYYLKSEIYLLENNIIKAKSFAQKGIEIAHKINVKDHILNGYKLLSVINEQIGNTRQALDFRILYSQLKDSIYNGRSSLQLAQMQVLYETNSKTKEIELLNSRSQAQLSALRMRNYGLAIAILMMTLFAYVLYKRYKYINKLNMQKSQIEQQNTELAKRNHEKDILLGEIHHRVKNNLQIISSILNLQSRKLADMGAKDAIQQGRSRVSAMALIHQQLYKHDHFADINIGRYLLQLVTTIADSFGYEDDEYQLNTSIDEIQLDIDVAIKIGLITNELITNVFKYAFNKSKDNKLAIKLRQLDKGALTFTLSDNGPGLGNDILENSNSFGLFLVKNLVDDMNGKLNVNQAKGTKIRIHLYYNGQAKRNQYN